MTQYIGVGDVSRLLGVVGIERFLKGLTAGLREDFVRWPAFEASARVASHSRDGVIELMPTSDGQTYAFKYVNGHPRNPQTGKLTVTAFGVLADVATGYPLLISEMTLLTALRTAATSVLAATVLSRPDSRTMALIGTGAQSEFQAFAFKALLGIEEVRIYDRDPAAMAKFQRNVVQGNVGQGSGLKIVEASSVAEAVKGADIVTTATAAKGHARVLTSEMIEPGMHINAIGGDCPGKTELDPQILRDARVFVEFTPQSRIEGEIQQVEADFAVTELWQVLTGRARGRKTEAEVTVFDSVGFAIEDFSTLRYVRELATRHRVGTLDLIPDLADPKDLFSLMRQPQPSVRGIVAARA